MSCPWIRVNGAECTASYDAVSADLVLEEGMIPVSKMVVFVCFVVITVLQCKTSIGV